LLFLNSFSHIGYEVSDALIKIEPNRLKLVLLMKSGTVWTINFPVDISSNSYFDLLLNNILGEHVSNGAVRLSLLKSPYSVADMYSIMDYGHTTSVVLIDAETLACGQSNGQIKIFQKGHCRCSLQTINSNFLARLWGSDEGNQVIALSACEINAEQNNYMILICLTAQGHLQAWDLNNQSKVMEYELMSPDRVFIGRYS
jgi:hypothetical protein